MPDPRFLVDESTGRAVARYLRSLDLDAVYVGDIMVQAADDRILERAVAEERVIITNDKDFGDKVFRDKMPHSGILLLRLSDHRAATKMRVVRVAIEICGDRLFDGFAIATERTVRLRRLAESKTEY